MSQSEMLVCSTLSISNEDGWYHPNSQQYTGEFSSPVIRGHCLRGSGKHQRFPSIDSDWVLQKVVTSQPDKVLGAQLEGNYHKQKQYQYIQVEASSPLANISPESLPMLEALCRQPQLLQKISEDLGIVKTSKQCSNENKAGERVCNVSFELPIPESCCSAMTGPSLPNLTESVVMPGMISGYKEAVASENISDMGSARTESTVISSEMEVSTSMCSQNTYVNDNIYFCNGKGQGQEYAQGVGQCEESRSVGGQVLYQHDPQSTDNNTPYYSDQISSVVGGSKGERVRRVKSNGPQEGGCRRGLPRGVVKRLSWWLCRHAQNPYPTRTEKAELAAHLGIDKTQVSNWFVNARTRFWKPIIVKIFKHHSTRLIQVAQESGNESIVYRLEDLVRCCATANINAPELVSLFDEEAIDDLKQAILDAFEAGFNEV
eukprot:TRINITY_DN3441_c0_g1_i1.p1 TRINITY_DN3441_c0_g1~~TRINITY_DN3441_c0_g1_i1.p1  ORF type:complete len:431 (+),score=30.39 TRINITY_DN3441_c0_g1_i1:166-1458(+)